MDRVLGLLKEQVREAAQQRTVTDVRIGLTYTAVLLDNGSAGVAYTFRREILSGCCSLQTDRPFAGKQAAEIIEHITSQDLLARTVGIAAANALINQEKQGLTTGDMLELLQPGPQDVVGMVGYFGPLVPVLQEKTKKLYVFEKTPVTAEEVFPEEQAVEMLPRCSTAIITSTTLINQTLDSLLEASANCAKIALVGPSTPLDLAVFEPLGVQVHIVSGVIITNPQAILQVVSEGGGMRRFKGHIKKVNMKAA